ncbi:MAG: LytTR family transcriptional regulator DNA-binding domain-containing protein, partial [Erysipelotrichaceae bacterium]|nr:LytTR family transcriptional regulator DNA-binding domain-containing protein [Erysipelotrichaceae bacterium]
FSFLRRGMSPNLNLMTLDQSMVFNPRNIQYIEYYNHHMKVVVGNDRYEGMIDDYNIITKRLEYNHFIQAHPHYLVNAAYIIEYKSHEIRMKNLDILPTTLRNIDIKRAIMSVKSFRA